MHTRPCKTSDNVTCLQLLNQSCVDGGVPSFLLSGYWYVHVCACVSAPKAINYYTYEMKPE